MSSWSCPYQTTDYFCQRVKRECVPGMKGCVLRGKVRFACEEEEPGEAPGFPGAKGLTNSREGSRFKQPEPRSGVRGKGRQGTV